MKRIGGILILLGLGTVFVISQDSIVSIPDNTFLHTLIDEGVDTNGDSLISYAEAEAVTLLNVSCEEYWPYKDIISDMSGIEAFTNLDSLNCSWNRINNLDVSNNTALIYLNCSLNRLTNLDVSNNTALTKLTCGENRLTSLDVSNNTALTYLNCSLNRLTSLDVSNNTALKELVCDDNQLTSLDVLNNTALAELCCYGNQLTSLDVSNNPALAELCCYGNQLTSLDVSNNPVLSKLNVSNYPDYFGKYSLYQLTSLDVSNNTALTELDCSHNQLTSLDVSNNTALTELSCGGNQLSNLHLCNNPLLHRLSCGENNLYYLNLSNNNQLESLGIENMPTLGLVCTGESTLNISAYGSPNINYIADCSCSYDTFEYMPAEVELFPPYVSFEDADIYSVHEKEFAILNRQNQELSIDSIHTDLIGSRVIPAADEIPPFGVLIFKMEIFPRTLKEFSGELHVFTSNPTFEDIKVPVFGNGHLSQTVVILKEIVDTVSMGYWKARDLKFPNYSADYDLRLSKSAITYTVPEEMNDNTLQPDSITGTWIYTTLEDTTVIIPKEELNFWLVLDATYLQEGDYYADVIFEWYNPSYYRGFIPVQLHVKDTVVSVSPKNSDILHIYPNPTSGVFALQTPEESEYDILIYSINGHLVYQLNLRGKTHELDISSFQKGVYFITIRSKDFVTTRKIIKL